MIGNQRFYPRTPVRCPACGRAISELRTSDLGGLPSSYHVGDAVLVAGKAIQVGRIIVHASCDDCHQTVSARAVIEQGSFTNVLMDIGVA